MKLYKQPARDKPQASLNSNIDNGLGLKGSFPSLFEI
jgi:hypothetical protein